MPYQPSTDPVVLQQAQQIGTALANNAGNADAGRAIYQSLMNNTHLTSRQKHAICCEAGRAIAAHGVELAGNNLATFLREGSAGTAFMTAAMLEMTPRYFQAVTRDALDAGARHGAAGAGQKLERHQDTLCLSAPLRQANGR